jgi:TPP-dependent indolepyruvate ferredoxin oxidoreductase alpha subunit
VEVVNPYDMKTTTRILEEKLDSQGVHVVISRAPCVFLLKQQKKR